MSFASIPERLAAFRPSWSPSIYKASLISMVALAFIIPIAIVAMPFNEFLNGMAAQPKGKAQMTFGRTADNRSFHAGKGFIVFFHIGQQHHPYGRNSRR